MKPELSDKINCLDEDIDDDKLKIIIQRERNAFNNLQGPFLL